MRHAACLFVLALAASWVSAAPPSFNPPKEVPVTSGVAVYMPPDDCVSVKYKGLDGEEAFPLELIGGSKIGFAFIARGLPEGKVYRFWGVASSNTGEQVEKEFSVKIPGTPTTPPVIPPPDVPTPPVPKGLYFLIIREDGPADRSFTNIMSDPAWEELEKAGHSYKPVTASEAKKLNVFLEPKTYLPAVVTLRVSVSGKQSFIVREAIPLPTASENIRKLPEGVE